MILGIDLGGTRIRGGIVRDMEVPEIHSRNMESQGSNMDVLQHVFAFTDSLFNNSIEAIGIGVPGLVDPVSNIVYDVVNIPSWKKIDLQHAMETRYRIPVRVNNDANCFALGEFYFGKGKGCNSMVGLTIGTGLGSGLILDKKLFTGNTGGAGEFGMIVYLDQNLEYYASGQFFQHVYKKRGEEVFELAMNGNVEAVNMYEEMGKHLGHAIKVILYALDMEMIVLGGSVRNAFPFFARTMWEQVHTFAFKRTLDSLRIEVSELENAGVLGAAALHYE